MTKIRRSKKSYSAKSTQNLFPGSHYFLRRFNFFWIRQCYQWTPKNMVIIDMIVQIVLDQSDVKEWWKKDLKMISTWHQSNTVKWTHILHANSYPRFYSSVHSRSLSVLFAKFVNSADSLRHNGMSKTIFQMLELWDLDDTFEKKIKWKTW